MQVAGGAQDEEAEASSNEGGRQLFDHSDDEQQLFDQQHKGKSTQQGGADVLQFGSSGSCSGSEPGFEVLGEGGVGFGSSSRRSSGSDSWGGGGFNAGTVKRCVARLVSAGGLWVVLVGQC